MNKKALIFLGSLLLLIVITAGLIFALQKRNEDLANPPEEAQGEEIVDDTNDGLDSGNDEEPQEDIPNAPKNDSLRKISDVVSFGPALSYDGKSIWYFTQEGKLFKQSVSSGLKQEYALPEALPVTGAIWPLTGSDFIVESTSGGNKAFSYYDSESKQFVKYASNIKYVDFMPDGRRVIYNWVESSGKSTLSIADFNSKNFRTLVELPQSDQVVKVSPQGTRAFTYRKSSENDGVLNYIPLDNPKVIKIKTGLSNRVTWAPDGRKFVFNKLDPSNEERNGKLWIGDITNAMDKPLDIEASPEKVVFKKDGSMLYVAAPLGSGESIWQINTNTYAKTEIFRSSSSQSITVNNLLLSEDGKNLYFKNSDGFLYTLSTQ
jgi:Tol biopolymer transport system component